MRVESLTREFIGDVKHVRRRNHDDVGTQITDQLHLLLRLAARHRNYRAAETLRSVVRSQSTGEQSVAVGHLNDISGTSSGTPNGARNETCPRVDIAARVPDDGRFSGRAARCMNAHDALSGHR